MNGLKYREVIVVKWIVFYLLMIIIAAVSYSAWMLGDVSFGEGFVGRFLLSSAFMFGVALVTSPITASTAIFC